jgi:hypothetical protein
MNFYICRYDSPPEATFLCRLGAHNSYDVAKVRARRAAEFLAETKDFIYRDARISFWKLDDLWKLDGVTDDYNGLGFLPSYTYHNNVCHHFEIYELLSDEVLAKKAYPPYSPCPIPAPRDRRFDDSHVSDELRDWHTDTDSSEDDTDE